MRFRKRHCARHGDVPCSCSLGRLSRLIEPGILLALKRQCCSHGYELADCVAKMELTDSEVEPGAVYRILRDLEAQGCVVSSWDTSGRGPARRRYELTPVGEELLQMWVQVLTRRRDALNQFLAAYTASPER
jgi:PadR family transcriptional regulator PadR